MKFVFIVFFMTSLPFFTLMAKDFFVSASAKIYTDDIVEAKERAMNNAQLKAVKKGVEIFLVKKTINENYEVIKNQIYNFNQNFLSNFKIVKQNINLDQKNIEVQIKARIAEEKIKQKLKQLGLLHERMGYKSLLLVYKAMTASSIPRHHVTVQNIIPTVIETYAENGFHTFDPLTMRNLYLLLDQDKSELTNDDILLALALNYNAEILVIMEIIPGERDFQKGSFYQVKSTVRFSIFNTADGRQIAEIKVNGIERSINNPDENQWNSLLLMAAKHAALETVRQSFEKITSFYQKTGEMNQIYSIVFSGYSPKKENMIIDYLEKTPEYRQLKELKNTLGHLELQMLTLKRKSILRRRITSDLIKQEIEVATKTLPGNHLFFINPNPMEAIEISSDQESKTFEDLAPESLISQ